jgi:hypothetical protein
VSDLDDQRDMLANMSDAELMAATQEAIDDCGKAERNSPWHEACFAASVVFSQECSKRGIRLKPLH